MEAIAVQWEQIEAQLQKYAGLEEHPEPFLNPGATEEEIVLAEKTLGVQFPEDIRASLKRHNGQTRYEIVVGIGGLLSTKEIVEQWSVWKELLDEGTFEDITDLVRDPGVKADWWNPRWIPITHDGCGNHDCLDMDPAEGGTVGQIIEMWHDDDVRPLRAPSFLSWLTTAASGMEAGTLTWEDGYGFTPKEHK